MEMKLLINTTYYKLFYCGYKDLESFLKTIISEPINYEVFEEPASNIIGEPFYYACANFKEAWDKCRYTWDAGFENFKEKINFLDIKYNKQNIRRKENKIVGYCPNVPKYLVGNPKNMRYFETIEKPKKVINLIMNLSYSASECQEAIINRGVCVLALINELETKGFNVDFNFVDIATSNDEMIYLDIPIKKTFEKLNVKKCYFPIVNPDFLRRLIFRGQEIIYGIDSSWSDGYGIPYVPSKEEQNLSDCIYIGTPRNMRITGANLEKDYLNFKQYIETKDYYQKNIEEEEHPYERRRTK